jgi:hypothetical protein
MNAKRRSAGAGGHYLKWMLALIVIAILLALLVPGVSAGWAWRRNITITNPGSDLTYLVTLSSGQYGNMNDGGSDLRFTDGDNSVKYNYWIEKWNNTGESKIWVKVPGVPSSGDPPILYMWYGNSDASSESNGDATFQFFDDFSSFIGTKWTTDGSGWSVSGGELKGTDQEGRLTSTSTFNDGVILEIKSRYIKLPDSGRYHGYQIGGFFLSIGNAFGFVNYPTTDYYVNDNTWTSLGSVAPKETELLTKISVKSTTSVDLSVTNYGTGVSYHSVSATNTVSGEPIALGRRYDNNYSSTPSYEAYWDWIRVRKYASTEPTTSVGAQKDTGGEDPVPELSSVILFSVGLIVLAGYVLLRRREKKKGE